MAQKNINLGTGELTGDGESLRAALVKVQENFTDVYASAFSGDYNDLTNKPDTDLTQVGVNILPDGSRDLGSPSANWDDVYAQKVWLNNSFAFQDQEVGGAGLKLSLLDSGGNKATLVADIEDYATETFVTNAVQALDDDLRVGTPGALDSLNELAAAINNDPNFATTVTSALALKANSADVPDFDQDLNTTDDVTFNAVTTPSVITGRVKSQDDIDLYVYAGGTGSVILAGQSDVSIGHTSGQTDIYGDVEFNNGTTAFQSGNDVSFNCPVKFTQSAPASSIGVDGDLQGAVAFDSNYIYYCTADYDGVTNIWKRVAWSGDTW